MQKREQGRARAKELTKQQQPRPCNNKTQLTHCACVIDWSSGCALYLELFPIAKRSRFRSIFHCGIMIENLA